MKKPGDEDVGFPDGASVGTPWTVRAETRGDAEPFSTE
jgi:hypothetical protein